MKAVKFYISTLEDNLENFVTPDFNLFLNKYTSLYKGFFIHIGLKYTNIDLVTNFLKAYPKAQVFTSSAFFLLQNELLKENKFYKFYYSNNELFCLKKFSDSSEITLVEQYLDEETILSNTFNNEKISSIDEFSLRTKNSLRAYGYETLGDLKNLNENDLLKIPNLGKKCVQEINEFLKKKELTSALENKKNTVLSKEKTNTEIDTLLNDINNLEQIINQKEFEIILARIGLNNPPLTLEEIGEQFNITRERVRQIEKKAKEKISLNGDFINSLDKRITKIREKMTIPLRPEDLIFYDSTYFKDTNIKPWLVPNILKLSDYSKNKLEKFKDDEIISALGETSLEVSIVSIETYIEDKKEIPYSEFLEIVDQHIDITALELRDYARNYIEKKHTVFFDSSGIKKLSLNKSDRGANKFIYDVLTQSANPLSKEEIYFRSVKNGFNGTERTIENALSKYEGALLFDRGLYGFRKHLNFSDDEISFLSIYVYEYIKSIGVEKHWFFNELAEIVRNEKNGSIKNFYLENKSKRFQAYEIDLNKLLDKVNKYSDVEISVIFQLSDEFNYLGKKTYVTKDSNTRKRVNFTSLVISMLEKSTSPMTYHEMKELQPVLKNKTTFQLHNKGRIIPIRDDESIQLGKKRNVTAWGLIDKHLNINKKGLNEIINELKKLLLDEVSPIDFEYGRVLIKRNDILKKFFGNINLLFLIAERSAYFIHYENRLYWTKNFDPKGSIVFNSLKKVIINIPHQGLPRKEAEEMAKKYYGKKFPLNHISYISDYEARYDEESSKFYLTNEIEIG